MALQAGHDPGAKVSAMVPVIVAGVLAFGNRPAVSGGEGVNPPCGSFCAGIVGIQGDEDAGTFDKDLPGVLFRFGA